MGPVLSDVFWHMGNGICMNEIPKDIKFLFCVHVEKGLCCIFHATMKVWKKNNPDGSLSDFVRLFYASLPKDRTRYRNHKAYQAAEYLIRAHKQHPRRKARRKRA